MMIMRSAEESINCVLDLGDITELVRLDWIGLDVIEHG
jgi:hypothetical protein